MVAQLGKPVDRSRWGMTPQTVNAYYNSTNNEIVFPAAILQPPFFDPNADDAVNYGAIGAVIGHEIGHGFDDQGRKSDGDGQPARLVDRRRREGVRGARAASSARSSTCSRPLDGHARQRQAHDGREHRRPERARAGVSRLPHLAQGQGGAGHRRLHGRPALLHRLRADLAHERPRSRTAPAAAHRLRTRRASTARTSRSRTTTPSSARST